MKLKELHEAGFYLLLDAERQFSDSTDMYYPKETMEVFKSSTEKIIIQMISEIEKYLVK